MHEIGAQRGRVSVWSLEGSRYVGLTVNHESGVGKGGGWGGGGGWHPKLGADTDTW
jgi:hypothetical protein